MGSTLAGWAVIEVLELQFVQFSVVVVVAHPENVILKMSIEISIKVSSMGEALHNGKMDGKRNMGLQILKGWISQWISYTSQQD